MIALFLAPHNDDETLFGSYLLLREHPHVIVCLRSERMASPHYPGGMPISAETREAETDCAMKVLGCTWEQWEILDGFHRGWTEELEGRLRILQARSPGVVYAPAVELGGHEQHNVIGELADRVFDRIPVIHYLTYTSKGRSKEGSAIEAPREWEEIKRQAMSCYRSQAAHPATQAWFQQTDLREFVE